MKQTNFTDRYTIKELLNESNMSIVYLAFDENLKREVIIKKLKAEKPTQEMKNRFKREIEILVELDHPGIIPIYECSYQKEIFYVMKYIKGKSLKELLPNISLESKLLIFKQILEIISFIHKRKILHRDIKPDNILIDNQGKVFIADFGISKFLNNIQTKLTTTDKFIGTIQYASPEHFDPSKLCEVSDVYSLGIILYEMLTGNPPFKDESDSQIMKSHLFVIPSPIESNVNSELKNICMKMLKKEIIERYSNCDEIINQLQSISKIPEKQKNRTQIHFTGLILTLFFFGIPGFLFQDNIKLYMDVTKNKFVSENQEVRQEETKDDKELGKPNDKFDEKQKDTEKIIAEEEIKVTIPEKEKVDNKDNTQKKIYKEMYIQNDEKGYVKLREFANTNSATLNIIPNGYKSEFKKTDQSTQFNKNGKTYFWYYSENLGGYIHGRYVTQDEQISYSNGLRIVDTKYGYKIVEKSELYLIQNKIMKKEKEIGKFSISKEKIFLNFKNGNEKIRCYSDQDTGFSKCKDDIQN